MRYAATAQPQIFHILWNNRIEYFDRTILMLFYRLCGKQVVLTAHNVNAARRDSRDSVLNRLTLWAQYHLAKHIFVHTEKMKTELMKHFGVPESAVTVLVHPINDAFPNTALTCADAKRRLDLAGCGKTMSFWKIRNPHYAELKTHCSETDCQEGKCLYLRLISPAFAACGHTSPVPHVAPTGLASRFRIPTRLYAAAAKVNTLPTL